MHLESRHQCLIYDGAPSEQLRSLAVILQRKLEEGYRCLYLNSPTMIAGLRSTLASLDIDVAYEIAKGRLVLSSETIEPGGDFNCKDMLGKLEQYLNQALQEGYKGLWATGDMSWEFGHKKNLSKLLEYELGLEGLFLKRKELCGICQYHRDTLPREAMRQGLLTHASIVINDTLSRINPHYLRSAGYPAADIPTKELDELIETVCKKP
jgi:MEDS: MEthanogen/methylotroph, DcmR Sensory domain